MKTTTHKSIINVIMMFSLSTMIFASCKKNEVQEQPVTGDANIRIVNTVSGSSAQELYQADVKVSTTSVAYGEFSTYIKVKAGSSTISLKNSGSNTVTATANVGLNTNSSYTAFYYSNGSGSGSITGYTDDNTPPATGKSKVRFVNLGPAFNNTINVSLSGGVSLFTGLAFDKPSIYTSLDANTAVDVTVLGSGSIITIPASSFTAGKIYTVWFDAASTTTAKYHIVAQN